MRCSVRAWTRTDARKANEAQNGEELHVPTCGGVHNDNVDIERRDCEDVDPVWHRAREGTHPYRGRRREQPQKKFDGEDRDAECFHDEEVERATVIEWIFALGAHMRAQLPH